MKRIPSSEMIGMRFERLVVLAVCADKDKHGHTVLECRCDCGVTKSIPRCALVTGNTKSCGCLNLEKARTRFITHGELVGRKVSATYKTWQNVKNRCNNPKCHEWQRYGGKGIKMCPQWEQSFERFLADVGRKPSAEYTIERIDSKGNYEPGNVKWATAAEQNRNTSQTRMIEFNGRVQCLTDWAIELGMSYGALSGRLNKMGWTIEKAFTTPSRYSKSAIINRTSKLANPLCPQCQSPSRRSGSRSGRKKFICINSHRFYDEPKKPNKNQML